MGGYLGRYPNQIGAAIPHPIVPPVVHASVVRENIEALFGSRDPSRNETLISTKRDGKPRHTCASSALRHGRSTDPEKPPRSA